MTCICEARNNSESFKIHSEQCERYNIDLAYKQVIEELERVKMINASLERELGES